MVVVLSLFVAQVGAKLVFRESTGCKGMGAVSKVIPFHPDVLGDVQSLLLY